MSSIIAKGFARKVPSHLIPAKTGQVWYIPHHGVYHAKKPNKIRVVFDCSARFGGTSLNDKLLQGPDLTNRLVGVLTRFREEPIAFMGDIDAMFHQVRVPEGQRDFLRFLWWPDGDLTQDLEEYQTNVHLFGAVSSPSCSNFALRKAADDAEEIVGTETADVLRKNFYVDDCLRSEGKEDTAIERIGDVRHACAHGGFNLAKFVSNSKNVLESIPEEVRAPEVRSLELGSDYYPVERALGVQWAIESDMFGFRIVIKDQPLTRRGILSTISSVYDPLGIAAPFLLVGKKILQDLCRTKLGWDDEISEEFRVRWERWRGQLPALERFSMERCLKPNNFGVVVSRQIHSFSDASSTGYGQVSCLRMENERGDVHCAFLKGKARVAPVKTMTIPRLELTAATVSVRVVEMIARELDEPVNSRHFWTDSTTVLKYISNENVANRVQTIRDATNPYQWRCVSSDWVIKWKRNPPAASHMGGVWERQVRSVRSILSALMREYGHVLDDESLRTLMAEVECIINSRPLTFPSSDPGDLDPLTPSHLLTMKSKIVMPPPGNFQKADVYLRRRWKRVQYLSNVFWSRWRKEYVQTLQERVKWNNPRRNLQRGDLVLIADDRVPRNQWNMARVVYSRPDSKGQVRSVKVATATTTLERPIQKLVLILENEEN